MLFADSFVDLFVVEFAEQLLQQEVYFVELFVLVEQVVLVVLEELVDFEGTTYPMTGVFRGRAVMKKNLRALGYYEGNMQAGSWMGNKGDIITGHVFHWSQLENLPDQTSFQLELIKENRMVLADGLCFRNTWAGYIHVHLAGCEKVMNNFLNICRKYKKGPKKGL